MWRTRAEFLVCVALPFVLFWWMSPFWGAKSIGNDYQLYAIPYQQELQFAWANGEWPLFVPGFCGGQSASALTLGQFQHPIAHLAAAMPGYWNGGALHWNTFWRLLSLGITHWALLGGLAVFVRRDLAALGAGAAVYNLRALDCFRYGSALEAHTGLLLLAAALCWHWRDPGRWRGRVAMAGATTWLVTSGYPQMAYYGLIGAIGLAIALPWLATALNPASGAPRAHRRAFWRDAAIAIGFGIALVSFYTVPFVFDFVRSNQGRLHREYAWAANFADTFAGTVDNFFQPLRSDVHGAFGGSPLFLLGASVPVAAALGRRVPRVIWIGWCAALLTFLHAQGGRTPVHWLAYQLLPLGGSLRVPGRIAIVLPLLLVLLALWALRSDDAEPSAQRPRLRLLGLAAGATVCWVVSTAGFEPETTAFAPLSVGRSSLPLLNRDVPVWLEPVSTLAGLGVLGALAWRVWRPAQHPAATAALFGAAAVQVGILLAWGTWVYPARPTTTWAELQGLRTQSFELTWSEGEGLYHAAVWRQLHGAALEPALARLLPDARAVPDVEAAFAERRRGHTPGLVTLVDGVPRTNSPELERDGAVMPRVELVHASYNHLAFETQSSVDAWFCLGHPFTGHWDATVDGAPADIHLADGLLQAVQVDRGPHRVEWRYHSTAATVGTALSALALASFVAWLALGCERTAWRWTAIAVAATLAAGSFLTWRHWCTTGRDLGWRYRWSLPRDPDVSNEARGKAVTASEPMPLNEVHRVHPHNLTDGDRTDRVLAWAGAGPSTWLAVDLGSETPVHQVTIFEPKARYGVNGRPLVVEVSVDGTRWTPVGQIDTPMTATAHVVACPPGTVARHVRVRDHHGPLALAELEVRR